MTRFIENLDSFLSEMDNATLEKMFDETLLDNASKVWKPEHDPQATTLLIASFGILVVFACCSNVFVCFVIFKNKKMHTVTNVFLANMAVSDLLLVLLNVPLNIARYLMEEWRLGDALCHCVNYSLMVSVYVSSFTLTAIALDRQFVLLYPLHPRITKRDGLIILLIIWGISLALSLPFGIFNKVEYTNILITHVKRCRTAFPEPRDKWEQYLTISTITTQYFLPLTIIAATYSRIIHKLWLRTHLGVVTETQRILQIQTKRKSIKLLLAVVVVFAICWMPLNLYHLLTDLHPDPEAFQYDSTTYFICHWIAISSSCINPFLYCWMNSAFRAEIKARLRCCLSRSRRQSQPSVQEIEDLLTHDTVYPRSTLSRRSLMPSSFSSNETKRSDRKYSIVFTTSL